jgi:hypothetical protein
LHYAGTLIQVAGGDTSFGVSDSLDEKGDEGAFSTEELAEALTNVGAALPDGQSLNRSSSNLTRKMLSTGDMSGMLLWGIFCG